MTEDLHAEYYRLVEQSKQLNKRIAELDDKLHQRIEPEDLTNFMNKSVDIMDAIVKRTADFGQRLVKLEHNNLQLELVCCQLRSFLIDNLVKRIIRLEEHAGIEEHLEGDKRTLKEWVALVLAIDFPRDGLQKKEEK